jgi:hypothetical protein
MANYDVTPLRNDYGIHPNHFERLIKGHFADEHGVWEIYGEDDNPDLGGSHYEPLLETVEGCFGDVVKYAFSLPRFVSWGGGGRIVKRDAPVKKITEKYFTKREELLRRTTKLERELAEVDNALTWESIP